MIYGLFLVVCFKELLRLIFLCIHHLFLWSSPVASHTSGFCNSMAHPDLPEGKATIAQKPNRSTFHPRTKAGFVRS
jgi:hypothetical protein